MKALSLWQPWAWAVARAGKDVENRQWRHAPGYRGLVLIHAAKKDDHSGAFETVEGISGLRVPTVLERGGLVAMARLVDVVEDSSSPWAIPGALHLVLADTVPLPFVPLQGQRGFFDVTAGQLGEHRDAYLAARAKLLAIGGAT